MGSLWSTFGFATLLSFFPNRFTEGVKGEKGHGWSLGRLESDHSHVEDGSFLKRLVLSKFMCNHKRSPRIIMLGSPFVGWLLCSVPSLTSANIVPNITSQGPPNQNGLDLLTLYLQNGSPVKPIHPLATLRDLFSMNFLIISSRLELAFSNLGVF